MKTLLYTICILLSACYPKSPRLHHFRGVAMEMPYHIQIGGALSPQKRTEIQSIIDSSFTFIHTCFDHWNPKSELSLINQLPILEKKKLSPRLLQLFEIADHIIEISEGRFNPALGLVITLWKRALPRSERVDLTVLESMRNTLQWNHISVEDGIFRKSANLRLDFDGIAKGFGIDLLLERLRLAGYANIYVDWAGDIAISGNHPSGRHWQIAIRNPISHLPDSEIIPLQSSAIATSGDYEQCWEIDGKSYCHIINPHTLHPIEIKDGSIASVTVIAPSCAEADGLATSAMTFTKIDDLLAWARNVQRVMPGVSFWIFERDCSEEETQVRKYVVRT